MEQTETDTMRQISLADLLARLGYEPVRRNGNELQYRAPYRNERAPSFRVNVAKQFWYDFGLGKGGDTFTLAGEFIRDGDFMEQVRFIANTANMTVDRLEVLTYQSKPTEPALEGMEAVPLFRSPSTDYLEKRGTPYGIASRYRCRLNYGVRGGRYFVIGPPNVTSGYEIQSKLFKGCVPPKGVSLVETESSPTGVCSVFEGFMDFLSAVALGLITGDCFVLNPVANVEKAMKHLDGYGRIDCFLNRDDAGWHTLATLKGHYGGRVCDRSALYDGCKDLSEYLQRTTKNKISII